MATLENNLIPSVEDFEKNGTKVVPINTTVKKPSPEDFDKSPVSYVRSSNNSWIPVPKKKPEKEIETKLDDLNKEDFIIEKKDEKGLEFKSKTPDYADVNFYQEFIKKNIEEADKEIDNYVVKLQTTAMAEAELLKNMYEKRAVGEFEGFKNSGKYANEQLQVIWKEIADKYAGQLNEEIDLMNGRNEFEYNQKIKSINDKAFEPKVIDKRKAQAFIDHIKSLPEWLNGNWSDRKDLVDVAYKRFLLQSVAENPDLDLNNGERMRQEFSYMMIKDMMRTPENKLTPYAVKTYFEDILAEIDQTLSSPEYKKISESMIRATANTMTPWQPADMKTMLEDDVDVGDYKKVKMLWNGKKTIEKLLRTPESKTVFWNDLAKGMVSHNYYELIPYYGSLIQLENSILKKNVLGKYTRILEAEEKGEIPKEKLTPEEELYIHAMSAEMQTEELKENLRGRARMFWIPGSIQPVMLRPSGYIVGEGVSAMLPYMGEFAGSSFAFTGTKSAVGASFTKGMEKLLGKSITKGSVLARSINGMKYSIASLAQTSLNPQMYVNETLRRMTPEVVMMLGDEGTNILSQVESNSTEPFLEAFSKAFGTSYAEFFTENLGGHVMDGMAKSLSWIGNKNGIKNPYYEAVKNNEWFKRVLIGNYMRKKGITDTDKAIEYFVNNRLGWNGIFEEEAEEIINKRLSDWITGDDPKGRWKSLLPWNYDWEREMDTFLTVSAFGGPHVAMNNLRYIAEGENYNFNYKIGDEKRSVKIPKVTFNIVKEACQSEDPKQLEKVIDLLKTKELTNDQVEFIQAYVQQEGRKKFYQYISKELKIQNPLEAQEKEEKRRANAPEQKIVTPQGKVIEPVEPEMEEAVHGKPRERTEEENRIIGEYPELDNFGLLDRDDEGIIQRPTRAYLNSQLRRVRKDIDSSAEYDSQGNITNLNDEIENLIDQRDAIEDALKKLPAVKGKGFVVGKGTIAEEEAPEEKPEVKEPEIPESEKEFEKKREMAFERHRNFPKVKEALLSRIAKHNLLSYNQRRKANLTDMHRMAEELNWELNDRFRIEQNQKTGKIILTDQKTGRQVRRDRSKISRREIAGYRKLSDIKDPNLKDFVEEMTSQPETLIGINVGLSTSQKAKAMEDIRRGRRSDVANQLLHELENMYDQDVVEYYDPRTKETRQVPVEDIISGRIRTELENEPVEELERMAEEQSVFEEEYVPEEFSDKDLGKTHAEIVKETNKFNNSKDSSKLRDTISELESGRKIRARITSSGTTQKGIRKLTIKDSRGRKYVGFFTPDADITASEISKSEKDIELRVIKKEDYNADEKLKDPSGKAYGDKIMFYFDGKPIANMLAYDYFPRETKGTGVAEGELRGMAKTADALRDIAERITRDPINRQEILPSQKKEIMELLSRAVEGLLEEGYDSAEKIIAKIKQMIKEQFRNLTEFMDDISQMLDENRNEIQDRIEARKIAGQDGRVKAGKFKMIDKSRPDYKSNESGVLASGKERLEALLKTFAPVWRGIAEHLEESKDTVEKRVFHLARNGIFDNIHTEKEYNEMIESLRELGSVENAIADALSQISLDDAVSMFVTYRSLNLVPVTAIYRNGGRFVIRDLNSSENIDEYRDLFLSRINTITKGEESGFDEIEKELRIHRNKKLERQSRWRDKTPEERILIRQEQYQDDLELLRRLTGIGIDVWKNYFVGKTRETFAWTNKDQTNAEEMVEFESYDEMIKNDIYRLGFVRTETNLVFQLTELVNYRKPRPKGWKFSQAFLDFFLQDSPERNVFSNLKKLATAAATKDDLALYGKDVQNNRFTSFILNSHFFRMANRILEMNLKDNQVFSFYKKLGIPMDVMLQNGTHDIDNKRWMDGRTAEGMSEDDVILSQLTYYLSGEKDYMQSAGQYGDKDALVYVRVPKRKVPSLKSKQWAEFKNRFPYAADAAKYVYRFIRNNLPVLQKTAQVSNMTFAEDLAREFVYNYVNNLNDLNYIVHGRFDNYNNLTDLIKRGGSVYSPGYNPDPHIEGGIGTTYSHVVADDHILDDIFRLAPETFNGIQFMSGDFAEKLGISIGGLYAKLDENEGILDSLKALHSSNDNLGERGLTKTNLVNIDVLANTFANIKGGSVFVKIRDWMKRNKVDTLSFPSGTKKNEHGETYNLFAKDKNGNSTWDLNDDRTFDPARHLFFRNTSDLFIQQDLRHSSEPKSAKQPIQLWANALTLPSGDRIMSLVRGIQVLLINETENKLSGVDATGEKIKWLKENVDEFQYPDLYSLLKEGATMNEPSFQNMIRTILASYITKIALDVPVNRVTTQEIPCADVLLKGLRKKGDKMALPECACNINGVRVADERFMGKDKGMELAMQYVLQNKDQFQDLFDRDGNLMEWEFDDDGVIPGEVVLINRVPGDDLHSHTIARVRYKFQQGNFVMLDKESQARSGSDFDGDQRFIQTFYKNDKGKVIFGRSHKGLANSILMSIARDYQNPENESIIIEPINTKKYDPIIKVLDKLFGYSTEFDPADPKGINEGRKKNIVGNRMKGIMSDYSSVFSFLKKYSIPFKKSITIDSIDASNKVVGKITLSGIVLDKFNLVKAHIGNLLNLAYDNAKDPKIEKMGLNEVTAGMFILGLIGNRELDNYTDRKSQDEAITRHIGRLAMFFNQPIYKHFVELERERVGATGRAGLEEQTDYGIIERKGVNITFRIMEQSGKYKTSEIDALKNFYYLSTELYDLRNYFAISREVPANIEDFVMAEQLQYDIEMNNLELLDTGVFSINDMRENIFAVVPMIMDFAKSVVFEDSIEMSPVGQQIEDYIFDKVASKKTRKEGWSRNEVSGLFKAMQNIAAIRSLNDNRTMEQVSEKLLKDIPELRKKMKDNAFLNFIAIQNRTFKGETIQTIEIAGDYRTSKISDKKLKEIRNDFSRLPEETKNDLALYSFYRFGISSSTYNGNYYSLFDNKFRVGLSKKLYEENNKWIFDQISNEEKLQIAEWIMRANRAETLRENAMFSNPGERSFNYPLMPNLDYPMTREGLEAITSQVNKYNDFWEAASKFGFDGIKFIKNYEQKAAKGMTKKEYAKKLLSDFENMARNAFARDLDKNNPVKDMLPKDAVGEALASNDPELQKFISDRLAKMFPGVQMFTGREEFIDFVIRNSERGLTVDPRAIGHAFKNAVFLDPNKAVQSTMFHEHAHIYWDALPSNDGIKRALIDIFEREGYDDPEEQAIIEIGRAGTELAKIELSEENKNRFIELLKQFWRRIKILLGTASKTDLINQLARDVWNNRKKINPSTAEGKNIIRNMVNPNRDNTKFDDKDHVIMIGDKPVTSATTIKKSAITVPFNEEYEAMQKGIIEAQEINRREGGTQSMLEKMKKEFTDENKQRWRMQRDAGTNAHMVAETIFGGKKTLSDAFIDSAFSGEAYNDLVQQLNDLKRKLIEEEGIKEFMPEEIVVSEKYKAGGIIDLWADKGDNHGIIYDFKTHETPYIDKDGNLNEEYIKPRGTMRTPFGEDFVHSIHLEHQIQTNIYAEIAEDLGNIVDKVEIIQIQVEIDDEGKIKKATVLENRIPVDRKKSFRRIIRRLLNINAIKMRDDDTGNKELSQLTTILAQKKIDRKIRRNMIDAIVYLKSLSANPLSRMNNEDMEAVMGNGWGSMLANLASNGFTKEDMTDPLVLEEYIRINNPRLNDPGLRFNRMEILFIASLRNVKKEELPGLLSPELEKIVYRRVLNPKRSTRLIYHATINGVGTYLREAGFRTLKKGDRVAQYIEREKGKPIWRFFHVVSTSKGRVTVEDDEFGERMMFTGIKEDEGVLKILEGKPAQEVKENSFVPRYLTERIQTYGIHFSLRDRKTFDPGERGGKEYDYYVRSAKRFWPMFDELDSIQKIRELANSDEKKLELLYQELSALHYDVTEEINKFIRENLFNHYAAKAIREEHSRPLDDILPATLEVYHMVIQDKDSVFRDFHRSIETVLNTVPRWIHSQFEPLNFYTDIVEKAYKQASIDTFNLTLKMRKLRGVKMGLVTENHGGMVYFRHPTDFPKGTIERDYLDLIYRYFKKYDLEMAVSEELSPAMIKVPEIFMTREESDEWYGSRWGKRMYNNMMPQKFDFIKLETGKTAEGTPIIKTLRQIKDEFAFEKLTEEERKEFLGNKMESRLSGIPLLKNLKLSSRILNKYIQEAQQIYNSNGNTLNPSTYIVKNKRRLKEMGKGSLKYSTQKYFEATDKVLRNMIFNYYMRPAVPILGYMQSKYSGEDNKINSWLTHWSDSVVFRTSQKGIGHSEKMRAAVNFFNRVNSLNKIAFSPKTQFYNLAIGQVMNLIREPHAFALGVKRLASNQFSGLIKIVNLLNEFDITNIIDDVMFDKIDKKMHNAENVGYWMMEHAEKINQGIILAGLMTESEWNAYDKKGKVVDPDNTLSRYRLRMIEDKIRDIHGDYAEVGAAPFWFSWPAMAVLQFKKWMPAAFRAEFMSIHRDRNFIVRSGIVNSVGLMLKIYHFNKQSDADRLIKFEKAMSSDNMDTAIEGANDYLNELIKLREGGRIRIREDVSDEVLRAFNALLRQMLFLAILGTTIMVVGAGDDDKWKKVTKWLTGLSTRFITDMFWYANPMGVEYASKNLVPATDLFVNLGKFITHFVQLLAGEKGGRYDKDTRYAYDHWWKWPIDLTYIIPAGSAARQVWAWGLWGYREITGENRINENAQKYDNMMRKMNKVIQDSLDKDIQLIMEDVQEQYGEAKRVAQKEVKSILWRMIEDSRETNEEIDDFLQRVIDAGNEIEKIEEWTPRKKKREAKKAFKRIREKSSPAIQELTK